MGVAHTGTYQFASNLGTPIRFIEAMGYKEAFKDIKPYSQEFDDKWRELAKDPTFEVNQHTYVRNRYYLVQLHYLNVYGIDFSGRGPSIQDMIWSTSVQFGPETSLIVKALRGMNTQEMTDEAIVTRIQDYKIEYNNQLFRSSTAAVRRGTLGRAREEKESLIALARAQKQEKGQQETDNKKDNRLVLFDKLMDALAKYGDKDSSSP
jgi:hypothetical protein